MPYTHNDDSIPYASTNDVLVKDEVLMDQSKHENEKREGDGSPDSSNQTPQISV